MIANAPCIGRLDHTHRNDVECFADELQNVLEAELIEQAFLQPPPRSVFGTHRTFEKFAFAQAEVIEAKSVDV